MPLYQPMLCTVNYLRQHRGLTTVETSDDALLMSFIQEASNEVIESMKRVPHPYVQTRSYDYGGGFMPDIYTLNFDEDLLELATLTNGDSNTISSTNYVLRSANTYPKWRIQLKSGGATAFTYPATGVQDAISIAGIWGYVPHYPAAWKALTTLNGGLTDTATSVVLASGTLVEVGHYLKVDSEQMLVTAISTNTATVERGQNGTTAAAHLTGATVSAFQQAQDIKGAVREIAAYYYKAKDRTGGRVTVFDGGSVTVEDLDPRVQKTIDRHKRRTIMGV